MSDYSKIAFTSAYRYEKIAIKGHTDFTLGTVFPDTVATVTINHDLGYKPYFKGRYAYGSGKYFSLFAGPNSYNIDGNGAQVDNINVTSTQLIIVFFNADALSSISGTVYYRIYAEEQQ